MPKPNTKTIRPSALVAPKAIASATGVPKSAVTTAKTAASAPAVEAATKKPDAAAATKGAANAAPASRIGTARPFVTGAQPAAPANAHGPHIVVFGMNEVGQAQAAWFEESEAEVAGKAARLMGLKVARVDTDAHRALATELRQGQIFAASRSFAPVVADRLYSRLFELCGSAPAEALKLSRPTTFDAIVPGSLVLAIEDDPEEGWWDAVVMAVRGHVYQVRWRFEARKASLIRSRDQIALLHAEAALGKAA